MKITTFIIFLIVSETLFLSAQPNIQWQKSLGGLFSELSNSISSTTDGGFIVAGSSESNDSYVIGNHGGIFDIWIVKLDSSRNIQWQKCLGGTGFEDANSIQQTTDGGFIIAGYTNSNDGDVSGNHGGITDCWIIKLDSIGNIQWNKCLGGTGEDAASSILQTSDGGFIFGGHSESNDGDVSGHHGITTNYDSWIVKLNSVGTIQWQKCFGGTGNDGAVSIQQTIDGEFVFAGATESNDGDVTGHHGVNVNYDSWIVKLNNTGAIQWQKCIGRTGNESAASLLQTSLGAFVITGNTNSNDGDVFGNHGGPSDCWIVKLDSLSNIVWQNCFGGSGEDGAISIQSTHDGGYITAGYTNSDNDDVSGIHGTIGSYDSWIVKLSTLGSIDWQKCLGGTNDDGANSIRQTSDGGYLIAGFSGSADGDVAVSFGANDYWIVKLSSMVNIDEIQNFVSNIQISPNPFSNEAFLSFQLSSFNKIKVEILNFNGQLIKSFAADNFIIGKNDFVWDGTDLNGHIVSDGSYLFNIVSDSNIEAKKIELIRK